MKEEDVKIEITQEDVKVLLLDTFAYDESDIRFINENKSNEYNIFNVVIENKPKYIVSEDDRILGMYDSLPAYVSSPRQSSECTECSEHMEVNKEICTEVK